jgi:3alpha(or 20beta)-hydroxysteroid dehydrogenase
MSSSRERVALVTGAASGIGAGIARRLHADGTAVVIADIDATGGERLAEDLGGRAAFRRLDIGRLDLWADTFEFARKRFGPVDILVNNAAVSLAGSIETASESAWRCMLDVNCTGTFLGCQQGVAAMRITGGCIVNIASARGHRVSASNLGYSCSKALVIRLTEGVALHCAEARLPIRCNAVCPGVIDTPILADTYDKLGGREAALRHFASMNPIGRLGTVEEIAAAVVFLASSEASFITGAILDADGGFRIRDR